MVSGCFFQHNSVLLCVLNMCQMMSEIMFVYKHRGSGKEQLVRMQWLRKYYGFKHGLLFTPVLILLLTVLIDPHFPSQSNLASEKLHFLNQWLALTDAIESMSYEIEAVSFSKNKLGGIQESFLPIIIRWCASYNPGWGSGKSNL